MNLSFKKIFPWGDLTDFEQKIESGSKIHTIREDPHFRWRPGLKIHMATGIRTKHYNCFDDSKICESIQSIKINYYRDGEILRRIEIIIDGDLFYSQEGHSSYGADNLDLLVRNDGFDSSSDFFRYFDNCFEGRILQFTKFRY